MDASKRLTLAQLPPILILHLKRFLYDKQGGCQKLQKEIDYTAELEVNRGEYSSVVAVIESTPCIALLASRLPC